jgi:hypothetical protein
VEDVKWNVDRTKEKGGRYSKNAKGFVPAKSTNISFYPKLWCKLFDLAKAYMQLTIDNTFPKHESAFVTDPH